MKIIKNHSIQGAKKLPIVLDMFWKTERKSLPIIIFCHGYKGYKDWGAWELLAKKMCRSGFFVLKFNFSHNGGSLEQPIDFPDLDAFGKNNYSLELDDLGLVIDWIHNNSLIDNSIIDTKNMTLIGHSRGQCH